jgi:hypothetical protein
MLFESNHIYDYSLFQQFEDNLTNEIYTYTPFSIINLDFNNNYNEELNNVINNKTENSEIENNETENSETKVSETKNSDKKRKIISTDGKLNNKRPKILKNKNISTTATVSATTTISSKSYILSFGSQNIRCIQLNTNEYIYNVIDIMKPIVSHVNNVARDLKSLNLDIEYIIYNKKSKYFNCSEIVKIFNKIRSTNKLLKYDLSKINYMNEVEKSLFFKQR